MRLAESHGVAREDFLANYLGSELDPLWLNRVSKRSTSGWKNFVARDKDIIKELRAQIHALASEIGLEIGEFRKIVQTVQKGERETPGGKFTTKSCSWNSRNVPIFTLTNASNG
jgi:RNA polymerase primary sigma factor